MSPSWTHTVDALTNLPNRAGFEAAFGVALGERREDDRALSVALVQHDRFEQIAQIYGQTAADKTLLVLSDALRRLRRRGDFAARIRGAEFALVLPGTDTEGAERMLERLAGDLAQTPVRLESGEKVTVLLSWGVAAVNGVNGPEAMGRAAAALTAMKRQRRAA